jgi:hypothetical protein
MGYKVSNLKNTRYLGAVSDAYISSLFLEINPEK